MGEGDFLLSFDRSRQAGSNKTYKKKYPRGAFSFTFFNIFTKEFLAFSSENPTLSKILKIALFRANHA